MSILEHDKTQPGCSYQPSGRTGHVVWNPSKGAKWAQDTNSLPVCRKGPRPEYSIAWMTLAFGAAGSGDCPAGTRGLVTQCECEAAAKETISTWPLDTFYPKDEQSSFAKDTVYSFKAISSSVLPYGCAVVRRREWDAARKLNVVGHLILHVGLATTLSFVLSGCTPPASSCYF